MLCLWFIFGLVSLPSVDMYFKIGLADILTLIKIEVRDERHLPCHLLYNQLASGVQWDDLLPLDSRIHQYGKQDFL